MSGSPSGRSRRPALAVSLCGGSGSGKSRLARYLKESLGDDAVVFCQDWYYRDHSHRAPEDCADINFDHPDAIETPLMLRQLDALLAGRGIRAPSYDYASHTRAGKPRLVRPARVVIVEGLFVLHEPRVHERMDLSVFIDVPADERLLRRVRRDCAERRVDLEETLRLYERFVRPMHERFVQPAAARATWRWRQLEDPRFPRELLDELRARLEGN